MSMWLHQYSGLHRFYSTFGWYVFASHAERWLCMRILTLHAQWTLPFLYLFTSLTTGMSHLFDHTRHQCTISYDAIYTPMVTANLFALNVDTCRVFLVLSPGLYHHLHSFFQYWLGNNSCAIHLIHIISSWVLYTFAHVGYVSHILNALISFYASVYALLTLFCTLVFITYCIHLDLHIYQGSEL